MFGALPLSCENHISQESQLFISSEMTAVSALLHCIFPLIIKDFKIVYYISKLGWYFSSSLTPLLCRYKSYFFPPIPSPRGSTTGQWLMDPNHHVSYSNCCVNVFLIQIQTRKGHRNNLVKYVSHIQLKSCKDMLISPQCFSEHRNKTD